ncbi:hypothetical protein TNCV_2226081 [Trichonephila clavipes]|nr:hypothetical protein TNCV_2226081 [Trichonephila clavipes]
MVKKKDGSSRMCIDYRKLNQKLVKDKFPLPIIEDVLDTLQEAKVYSTLDLRNGFFLVGVDEDCRKYTSFIVPDGLFEFNKVSFGLSTSPGVFQHYVSSIFRDLTRKGIVISYLDDLVIPAKNEQEGLEKLKIIFEVAKKYGLEIKFKKCQFLKKKIEFLGHIVESGTIKPSPTKTLAVRKFPEPTTIKQVQKEFDYETENRAGNRMKHVDALSRYSVMIVCNDTLTSKLKKAQQEDDNIQTLKSLLEKQESEEFFERNVLTKLSLDDSTKWYKYVDKLQRILNSTICRSTKWTPFELLVGTKMRNKEDILIKDLLLEEMAKELLEQREFLRNVAKKNIEILQSENRKTYNRRRKKASLYKEGDLVAIQRTQFGAGLKLKPKFLGPYKVTKVNSNDRNRKRVQRNPRVSMRQITRDMGIRDRSVRRIAKTEIGLKPYKLRKVQFFTEKNKLVLLRRRRKLLIRAASQQELGQIPFH